MKINRVYLDDVFLVVETDYYPFAFQVLRVDHYYFLEKDLGVLNKHFPEFKTADEALLCFIEHPTFRLLNVTQGLFHEECLRFADFLKKNDKVLSQTERGVVWSYNTDSEAISALSVAGVVSQLDFILLLRDAVDKLKEAH